MVAFVNAVSALREVVIVFVDVPLLFESNTNRGAVAESVERRQIGS